ncbi:UDP-glycosyltransferase 76F1-like isoform X2 [Camellia sinensis]|uniref:UDP-glycosyltransferase 76F1-like isoform X2 n=1 Tax=Camellia sinensis TaxID=4442 RepID=UPI0010361C49|nr:UDP-glycosyltransferase 76F1-like isoform X2 [Camellia sinensis]
MQQTRQRHRVVLLPLPLQGHINPMLQLANILHSHGFSITIILHTSFPSPNPSNYPHFTFLSFPDGLSQSEASTTDLLSLILLLNLRCINPFRDCLVKLSRLVLRTGGVSSYAAFAAFPTLFEKGYFPVQDSRLEEPISELPPLRVKDLPVIKTSNFDSYYQFLTDMVRQNKASSGLIFNSFEELEQPALATLCPDFHIPIFPIGPFHRYFPASSSSLLTHDETSIPWLKTQAPKSVLYVSIGSIAAMDEKEFLEAAWGLANSKQPFLWVVRPGSVRGRKWLESLPNGFIEMLGGRGHIVNWAPQQDVLAHPAVGAFWTHNGWNSTLESICEGVPMICMPRFTDQLVNARYVSHVWGVGVQLENGLERGDIERAIRGLMVEKEGKEIRERMLHLKEKVNLCVMQGGSSHESLQRLISHISSF